MIYYYEILNNITNYTSSFNTAQQVADSHVKFPFLGTLILLALAARWAIILAKMFYARDERMRSFIKLAFQRKSSMVSWQRN